MLRLGGQRRPLQGDDLRWREASRELRSHRGCFGIFSLIPGHSHHHFYDFQVFFIINICFQEKMNITNRLPKGDFLLLHGQVRIFQTL